MYEKQRLSYHRNNYDLTTFERIGHAAPSIDGILLYYDTFVFHMNSIIIFIIINIIQLYYYLFVIHTLLIRIYNTHVIWNAGRAVYYFNIYFTAIDRVNNT